MEPPTCPAGTVRGPTERRPPSKLCQDEPIDFWKLRAERLIIRNALFQGQDSGIISKSTDSKDFRGERKLWNVATVDCSWGGRGGLGGGVGG